MGTHWLDRAFAMVFGTPRLFHDGWGDERVLEEFQEHVRERRTVVPLVPSLRPVGESPGTTTFAGTFESPVSWLPSESRTGHFQLVLPATGENAPVLVVLASSGDEGYGLRRRMFLPLVGRGIGLLVLESPFYGVRRPVGQNGSNLRMASDLFAMCSAAIHEAVGLLAWLRAEGRVVGIGGYSMGGSIAALAAVCAPFPVATVLGAVGVNGASVVTRDLLSRQVHWDRLGDPGEARSRFAEQCGRVALDRLRPPFDPASAILVACTGDGYVDPAGVAALHGHWPGSTLRWIGGGHISMAIRSGALLQATEDAFAKRRASL